MENKKLNFWDLMDNPDNKIVFAKHLYRHLISNLKDAFGYCCREKMTLNEYCPLERFGNLKNEATTFISVRMSELWENAIFHAIKELFGEIEIDKDNVKRWTDAEGDIKIFNESWEIKTSQAKDSFTGATHSTHKVRKYILVNYRIDRDIRLQLQVSNLKGFIPKLSIYILDLTKSDDQNIWKGEAKRNSSFSTMHIKNDWVNSGCLKVIWGDINVTKFKNAKVIHKSPKYLDDNVRYDELKKLISGK